MQGSTTSASSLLLVGLLCACTTLTPAGSRVVVYQAPLDAPPARRSLPASCTLLGTTPRTQMPEADLEGQKDPFRVERNAAGAAGANALLVLKRQIRGRRDFECTAGLQITDCPSTLGAWFDVEIERYACSADALAYLATLPRSNERDQGGIDGR